MVLQDGVEVNIITGPYFLGTKMEAFLARGNEDYYASHDLEEMIAVIDGRPGLVNEIQNESAELQNYLADEFNNLLPNDSFIEALPGHLPPDQASQARVEIILERLRQIINLKTEGKR